MTLRVRTRVKFYIKPNTIAKLTVTLHLCRRDGIWEK